MYFLKTNKYWILGLLVVAGAFFYVGKNSNPAKIETVEVAKAEEAKDVKAAEATAGLVSVKKTTSTDTKANGDKKELTVEEFLSAYDNQKSLNDQSKSKSESVKSTTTVNSVLFVRGGVVAPIQSAGLPNPKALAEMHALATLSYGAWEAVLHSDLKVSTWAGIAWGFGF